jgi:hypothetical protein
VTPDTRFQSIIVSGTARAMGRADWIPAEPDRPHALGCGRIRADASMPPIHVDPGPAETALVCLAGSGWVRVGTERFRVARLDTVYVPRDTHFMVWSAAGIVDIAEVRAVVDERYPLQFVGYEAQRTEWLDRHPEADPRFCVLLGDHAAAGRLGIAAIDADMADGSPWPQLPDIPAADVACWYERVPVTSQGLPIGWRRDDHEARPASVHEGDLVVGAHQWLVEPAGARGPLAVLWMIAAHRESAADRFRLPRDTFPRSRVVP